MKALLTAIACILTLASTHVSAQTSKHFFFEARVSAPLRQIADTLGMTMGGGFTLGMWQRFTDNVALTLSAGAAWNPLTGTVQSDSGTFDLDGGTLLSTPLLAGGLYVIPLGTFNPYFGAELGATFVTYNTPAGTPSYVLNNDVFFVLGGRVGTTIELSESALLLVSARYLHMTSEELSFIDGNVGLTWRF
jgi:outer membrane protein W